MFASNEALLADWLDEYTIISCRLPSKNPGEDNPQPPILKSPLAIFIGELPFADEPTALLTPLMYSE